MIAHLLQACEAAQSPFDRGRRLEDLMVPVFTGLPGVRRIGRNLRDVFGDSEIDIALLLDRKNPLYFLETVSVLVECKKQHKSGRPSRRCLPH